MTQNKMTEAQVFRFVAERLVTTDCKDRHPICFQIADLARTLRDASPRDLWCDAACHRADNRVKSYLQKPHETPYSPYAYALDPTTGDVTRNDEGRALACLWMALEAEAEARDAAMGIRQ